MQQICVQEAGQIKRAASRTRARGQGRKEIVKQKMEETVNEKAPGDEGPEVQRFRVRKE